MPAPIAPPAGMMQILSSGQSLGMGTTGSPQLSTTQYYGNKSIHSSTTYDINNPTSGSLSQIPLVTPLSAELTGYEEDPATTVCNALSQIALFNGYSSFDCINTIVNLGGKTIAQLGKNGSLASYQWIPWEATAHKHIANAAGKTLLTLCGIWTHGESEASSITYAADVYGTSSSGIIFPSQADIQAITGQASAIPWFVTQMNSQPKAVGNVPQVSIAQWRGHATYPGLWVMVGPKYQFKYNTGDHIHLFPAQEYRKLGDLLAKVIWKVCVLGQTWNPVQPTAFGVSGSTCTITFNVPVGSLAWDTSFTTPHGPGTMGTAWGPANGFEATELPNTITGATNANPIAITTGANHGYSSGDLVVVQDVGGNTNANTISSVTVTGPNTFTIPLTGNASYTSGGTCARILPISTASIQNGNQVNLTFGRAPSTGLAVSYACFYDSSGGFANGYGGLLRDSDTTLGVVTGAVLYNYCVAFQQTGLT